MCRDKGSAGTPAQQPFQVILKERLLCPGPQSAGMSFIDWQCGQEGEKVSDIEDPNEESEDAYVERIRKKAAQDSGTIVRDSKVKLLLLFLEKTWILSPRPAGGLSKR